MQTLCQVSDTRLSKYANESITLRFISTLKSLGLGAGGLGDRRCHQKFKMRAPCGHLGSLEHIVNNFFQKRAHSSCLMLLKFTVNLKTDFHSFVWRRSAQLEIHAPLQKKQTKTKHSSSSYIRFQASFWHIYVCCISVLYCPQVAGSRTPRGRARSHWIMMHKPFFTFYLITFSLHININCNIKEWYLL